MLMTQYEYSLDLETPRGVNPIESFLFYSRRGHCEYFASAMALLLRAIDIPSRVVSGFYSTEYNEELQQFVVRQSDAHSWVEVWLDGLGWIMLDPTPPDLRGRALYAAYNRPFWDEMRQRARVFWQTYVLDYSSSRQIELMETLSAQTLSDGGRQFARSVEDFMRVFSIERLTRPFGEPSGDGRPIWLAIRMLLIFVPLGVTLWIYRRFSRARMPGYSISTIAFMNRLLKRLEKAGWRRRPGQTPMEFIRQVHAGTQGRWPLDQLLEIYHRARFGGVPMTARDQADAADILKRVGH
jgi:hypothetical protein